MCFNIKFSSNISKFTFIYQNIFQKPQLFTYSTKNSSSCKYLLFSNIRKKKEEALTALTGKVSVRRMFAIFQSGFLSFLGQKRDKRFIRKRLSLSEKTWHVHINVKRVTLKHSKGFNICGLEALGRLRHSIYFNCLTTWDIWAIDALLRQLDT